MKRLILFEIILIFFATTFERDSPPGWFQQSLPVNDVINDIFFIDSLNGWVVTNGRFNPPDTSFILRTTNGGGNWVIQKTGLEKLNSLEFLDNNTGYVVGGSGNGLNKLFKTINGGLNWNESNPPGTLTNDLDFVNKDTGWISVEGNFMSFIFKTTDGASSWQQQYSQSSALGKIFMLSKDTGWFVTAEVIGRLFRTTNGGMNWGLQSTLTQQLNDVYFFNGLEGIITSGISYVTTNGGFNWNLTNDGGIKIGFADDSLGWAGSNFSKIMRTINRGNTWYRQTSPIFDNSSIAPITDSTGWGGGTGLVKTTDGGGPPVGIIQISSEIPKDFVLYQNYPNPFNPKTKVRFQITRLSDVRIVVYDIQGRELKILVNNEQNAGTYEADFDGSGYSSGIYFYSLIIDSRMISTRKMLLVK